MLSALIGSNQRRGLNPSITLNNIDITTIDSHGQIITPMHPSMVPLITLLHPVLIQTLSPIYNLVFSTNLIDLIALSSCCLQVLAGLLLASP